MAPLKIGKWVIATPTAIAVAAVLGLTMIGGGVRYSESPGFCNSCHIMAPYYNAWKASKHAHVRCVECHYPPASGKEILWHKFQASAQVVKYVTRTYSSKPFAEVEDASCLRSGCHSTRLLEGRVVAKNQILFDHRPHLTEVRRGRQLRCVSCHSQVMVGSHIEVTFTSCFLCHFKGRGTARDLKPLGGCTGCHELPKKDFQLGNMKYNHRDFVTKQKISCQDCHLDVVQGTGEARKDRCFSCHNQPEKIEKYDDHTAIHDNHVRDHKVACMHCHDEIRHGLRVEAGKLPSISDAAAGKVPEVKAPAAPPPTPVHALAFECSFCHENKHLGQREMYTGRAQSLGLPEIPSPMFQAEVDCVGCHYKQGKKGAQVEFSGANFKASEESCVKCHGKKFEGIWEETKKELGATLDKLDAKAAAARAAAGAASGLAAEKAKAAVKDAERLAAFVRVGRGEHNVYMASMALRKADKELTAAGESLTASLPDLSDQGLISGAYCATMCHERVGVKVPPETVKYGGKTMPHGQHAGMMGCVRCHDIGGHKRVPLKKDVKKNTCAECHPQ